MKVYIEETMQIMDLPDIVSKSGESYASELMGNYGEERRTITIDGYEEDVYYLDTLYDFYWWTDTINNLIKVEEIREIIRNAVSYDDFDQIDWEIRNKIGYLDLLEYSKAAIQEWSKKLENLNM